MSSLLDLMWGDKQEENMVMEMLPFPPSIFFFFFPGSSQRSKEMNERTSLEKIVLLRPDSERHW